ncbi:intercellular adhesion molecule 2 [Erinaceus europaeus]|uniref:Intercellular adhesion molecule 2 n=1 Tax=Erinaceus europaeus TaxID=9365 RepID=A0ABM3YBY0_ERIEU|nr:intercellular adhesion molecule 2 [Erinaceus europaeus]
MCPLGGWGLRAVFLSLLSCQGSGEEAFEVNIWSEEVAVEPGGSWTINCSTSCVQPSTGGLETSLTKNLLKEQTQWKLYLVSNASQDTTVHCYFTCADKQQAKWLNISVFHPPKQVLLKLQPSWVAVGRPFTMECTVPAVAPLSSLTLSLLRGEEILHNQTFQETAADPQNVTVTHNTTAHREDGHHNFSCQAELDLRPLRRDVIRSVSSPQTLEVYEIIQDNQMVIIITVVSVLLFLFVTSVLLCFAFGQHWRQQRTGAYGVQAAWRSLRRPYRAQPATF